MKRTNTEQDELIEFLLDQNWRLTKRITAVSAKSNRKSRHIKNLLKGLNNANVREKELVDVLADLETENVKGLARNEQTVIELEQAELRISELSYENSKSFKVNKALCEHQDYLHSVIQLKEQHIQRLTSIETTKDKDLEKKLSNEYLLVLAGATGCGIVLGILGVLCLVILR